MVLPPPLTVPNDFPLPSSTRASLQRLLSALGIPSELIRQLDDTGDMGLRSFLIDAAEHVRWNEATDASATTRLHNAALVFRMTREVTVKVGDPCQHLPRTHQADLVEKLAASLDRAPSVDLHHLTIVLGGEGIDASGRLWLSPSQSSEDWLRVILSTDVTEMRRRKAEWDQVQEREKSIAQSMSIGMIYTSGDLRMESRYAQFLESLQSTSEMMGQVLEGGRGSKVALCIVDGDHGIREDIDINNERGFFSVPIDLSPVVIYRFIQDHYQKACDLMHRYEMRTAELEDLRRMVIKRLRLRRLEQDPRITNNEFRVACQRLIRHADRFGDWTDGLPLRISNTNRLTKASSTVEIKWNLHP